MLHAQPPQYETNANQQQFDQGWISLFGPGLCLSQADGCQQQIDT